VGGIVIQDIVEEALGAALIDGGEHAEGAVLELLGGHRPGKISQGPVQAVGIQARLRLFFPQPRPSAGSWQKGQRRGDLARGASARAGRAGRPRPQAGPPEHSRGGGTDRGVAPERRGPRSSTGDTSYRRAEKR
jgi:hypothetical protein